MTLLSLVVCILFSVIGINAAHPFVLASHMRDRNDALERELKRVRIQNQIDEREIRALEDPQGVEMAARKHGFVFPQEYKMRVPTR